MAAPVKGKIGSVEVVLASGVGVNERYSKRLVPVNPRLQFLPNDPTSLAARFNQAYWKVDDWSDGEGEDVWDPGRAGSYRQGTAAAPERVRGRGLELGPPIAQTTRSDASEFDRGTVIAVDTYTPLNGGSATETTLWAAGGRMVSGFPDLFLTEYTFGSGWDTLAGDYTYDFGTGTRDVTGLIVHATRIWVLAGSGLFVFDLSTGTFQDFEVFGATNVPSSAIVLASDSLELYGVSGQGLYRLTFDAGAIVTTQLYTQAGSSITPRFVHFDPDVARQLEGARIASSDVGVVWWDHHTNGARIFEYNTSSDTGRVVAVLPGGQVPTSIAHTNGVTFLTVVTTEIGNGGLAYLVALTDQGIVYSAPLRGTSDDVFTFPIIAGVDGDDLIIHWDGALWTYNLSSGGLFHLCSTGLGSSYVTRGLVWNGNVFLTASTSCDPTSTASWNVHRIDRSKYATTGSVESGAYDLGFFDVPKTFMEVIVTTDPLPANTTLQLAYRTDYAAAFTTHSDTKTTDGDTVHSFVLSDASGTVTGRTFEHKIILNSTSETATPTVRSIMVRAVAGAHEVEWILAIDAATSDFQHGPSVIAALKDLAEAQTIVSFEDPWSVDTRSGAAPTTHTVKVMDVVLPSTGTEGAGMYAQVRLLQTGLEAG